MPQTRTQRSGSHVDNSDIAFFIEPYLQLGRKPNGRFYELVWFSSIGRQHWRAQHRPHARARWTNVEVWRNDRLKLPGAKVKQFLARVPHGEKSNGGEYRLLLNDKPVFASTYKAPGNRVVVFGDFADTAGDREKQTARATLAHDPSLIVMPGDLVYEHGRVAEFREKFFPVLNAGDESKGAPLLRSRVVAACLGNHDVGLPKDCEVEEVCRWNDLFGYFYLLRQPGNGPRLPSRLVRNMVGGRKKGKLLMKSFGTGFTRFANFSFDWGNQHWVVLDANTYMDWSKEELRAWLRKDLAASRADWKLVVFHQAPFNSDFKYRFDQRMRAIFDILQEESVDVVFCGHCHYYERHFPLKVEGAQNIIDRNFDGVTKTKPQGIIEIITGASGSLVTEHAIPKDIVPTSAKLVYDKNSVTVLDVDGRVATIRQIATDGTEVDRIVIDKR